MPRYQRHLFVCTNLRPQENPTGSCAAKGSEEIRAAIKEEVKRRGLKAVVRASESSCLASCSSGVTVVVYPEGVWYGGVKLEDVGEIMERHVLNGEVVERLLLKEHPSGPLRLPSLDLPSALADLQRSLEKDK
jgi:(2Fe-2S) ferredoxin